MPWVPSVPRIGRRRGTPIIRAGSAGSGAPVNVVAPVISGTAETGQTMSCNGGAWSGATPITLTYQWKNAGVNISGATASTYLLDVTDEGDAVKCAVTATNASGNSSADSNTVTPSAPSSGTLPLQSATVLNSTTPVLVAAGYEA